MKAEIQALEQALSEVVTSRQRLDAAADLIRNSLAALRQAELAAERAAMAAAAAQEVREQAAREQAARELAEKDAAAARAKEITQQFATVMDVVTKLAQGYFDGLRKDREAERLREEKRKQQEAEQEAKLREVTQQHEANIRRYSETKQQRAKRREAPPNGQS